ncbi:ATP-binding protein [Mesorhizobium sp.]|uniref:NACHT domain-containing protein n=2 Tax=Mesorhizobium sp. TaxID=1871066 RepID=UPI0012273CB4|nr:ATP-binding protein [Mesorhizobium sp.]TIR04084.1 MAG: hypothetical protein E5X32_22720 [Mesorhizobium sp.]
MTSEERRSFDNGIWLCSNHAHQIDHDEGQFTEEILHKWKQEAEQRAYEQLTGSGPARIESLGSQLIDELKNLAKDLALPAEDDLPRVKARVATAATRHLEGFERRQPGHISKLLLRTCGDDATSRDFDVDRLAGAFQAARELAIVAPPGTGKTTTMIQLARRLLDGGPVPIVIPLAEAADTTDFFAWAANRYSFAGLTATHLMFLAHHGELAFLLDGWNEVPRESRRNILYQLGGLRRDFPLLAICMSTRRQSLDVPVQGRQLDILPLSEGQQNEIAVSLKGVGGARVLDHAQRTPGLRGLITIPLYLVALLNTSHDGRLPETKEEILRLFVEEHERSPENADVLDLNLSGQQSEYLSEIAVAATRGGSPVVAPPEAAKSIARVNNRLVASQLITTPLDQKLVLDTFVAVHSLQRDVSGNLSFQHEQFQEWYASRFVEAEMQANSGSAWTLGDEFCVSILNDRRWEEAVLFACERLSRLDEVGARAVASVVDICLQIDPSFAAGIIYRSGSLVWAEVGDNVQAFAKAWHTEGTADQALRFMIATGRGEFADAVWPLVTSADEQLQLSALRMGYRWKPSVLGPYLDSHYANLEEGIRSRLLSEFVYGGGVEGLLTAAGIARTDPSSRVKADVFQALLFRRAEQQALMLLSSADDETWKIVAKQVDATEISDANVVERINRYQEAEVQADRRPSRKLAHLLTFPPTPKRGQLIYKALCDPVFDFKDSGEWTARRALEEARGPVSAAFETRVAQRLTLPWNPDEFLANVADQDSGPIPDIVFADDANDDVRKNAARVIGPATVRALIDEHLEAERDRQSQKRQRTRKENFLSDLIGLTRQTSFFETITAFEKEENPATIADLAELIAGHGRDPNTGALTLTPDLHAKVLATLCRWAETLLSSATASRHDFGKLASAMKRFPDDRQTCLIARMLDEDLRRYREERAVWARDHRAGRSTSNVSYSWTYRDVLTAIGSRQAADVLLRYLDDEEFGYVAAAGLRLIWMRDRGLYDPKPFRPWPDFERAAVNREKRYASPAETSEFAEAMFRVIQTLVSTRDSKALTRAAALAAIAVVMPHGNKQAILDELISADVPAQSKLDLAASMVVGGLVVRSADLVNGLQQLFDEAVTQPWRLGQDLAHVVGWLKLFPFSDRPFSLFDAFELVPHRDRLHPWQLRGILDALRSMPKVDREGMLRRLATYDCDFVREYDWFQVALTLNLDVLIDLLVEVVEGKFGGDTTMREAGHRLPENIAGTLQQSQIMALVKRFNDRNNNREKEFLASVLMATGSGDAFLALVADPTGRQAAGRQRYGALRDIVFRREAVDTTGSVYEHHPVDISTFRKGLFGLSVDPDAEVAEFARICLEEIDDIRDATAVDTEPRHPDISTRRPWPIVG